MYLYLGDFKFTGEVFQPTTVPQLRSFEKMWFHKQEMIDWSNYLPAIITGGATFIAGIMVAIVGFIAYYKQKEYELCKQRYLEEGFDVVVSVAQQALSIYNHNWARIIEILKSFRDTSPEDFDLSELEKGFIDLSESRFPLIANYRVRSITQSDTIWNVFQLLVSFAQKGISISKKEIPLALRMKISTDKIQATKEEMFEDALNELQKLQDESYLYYEFLKECQKIIDLLETQKFSFKKIRKISKNPVVIEAISNLQNQFKDKLEVHDKGISTQLT